MNKLFTGFLTVTFFVPSFTFAVYHVVHTEENIIERRDSIKKDVIEKRSEVRTMRKEEMKVLRTDTAQKRENLKMKIKEKQDALKTDIKQRREAIKIEAKTISPEALKEKRTMFRQDVKKERSELHEQIKEKREAFKNEAKERVEALRNKLSEERAKRVEVFFGTMVRKFDAAISRLRNLADRIDSRIDKFEDTGKDVVELRTSLEKAMLVIDEAESALDRAKEEFNALAQSENLQEYFKKVKEITASVAQKIKDAHKVLIDVTNSIKGVSNVSQ